MYRPAVIMDNGTGYTKMGFAGNKEPSYVLPTAIAVDDSVSSSSFTKKGRIDDLVFEIGDDAVNSKTMSVNYPIRHGTVDNWDNMERYWQRCIYKYLRCDPEEHYFLLTEPPLNAPENREFTAEIMFETFNVAGLYIGVQAVLALAASWTQKGVEQSLTGTVIDSGDGVTHVIPVAEGYVIGSAIKSMPIAGKDLTQFVQQTMRDRGEKIPPEMSFETARTVKERNCWVAKNPVTAFKDMDNDPSMVKIYESKNPKTNQPFSCRVLYEQFMTPEIFFSPEIHSSDFLTPLPTLVDKTIQACPIDTRRGLYKKITLSGGSTLYKNFGKRLEKDIKKLADERLRLTQASGMQGQEMDVKVVSHKFQRYAVWFGGSMLASGNPEAFVKACHSKAEYEEYGPSICRYSPVFGNIK